MLLPAAQLHDAIDRLAFDPIVFDPDRANANPDFYVTLPPRDDAGDGVPGVGPTERLRRHLLGRSKITKVFLSGHVGAGKSTQINRLAADESLKKSFTVLTCRIEEGHRAFLDATQLLFLIVDAVFSFGLSGGFLDSEQAWQSKLKELNRQIFGDTGIQAKEGSVGAEWNLVFVKIKQDLKLSESRRELFRERGETLRSALLDALGEMLRSIEERLAAFHKPLRLLLLIDDLDKVREPSQHADIFNKNLELFLNLPLRILFTVPTGVVFGSSRAELRRSIEHLFPIRVIDKAPETYDPEKAFIQGSDAFFRDVVHKRIAKELITDKAIKLAAIYSGGVLREFFRLLQEAAIIADVNQFSQVDADSVQTAVREVRRRETMGLLEADYQAFAAIHRSHSLGSDDHRKYLTEGLVLECYNDRTWYEVNPILWKVLEHEGRNG